MPQQELLKKVIQILNQAKIQYMVTGSIASSLYGEPRSTHDIDIVVDIHKTDVRELVTAFPPSDFYLDEDSILEAINKQGMFNLIDINTGGKIDFWILTGEDFDLSRFSRKISEKLFGIEIQVTTPEDTILAKLRWAKLSGGSEKQFTDALRVYEVQYENLDIPYLEHWVEKLDIKELWEKLRDMAQPL